MARHDAPHHEPLFSDLWGGPPRYAEKVQLGLLDRTHIYLEKTMPTQIYRRAFKTMCGRSLAKVQAGGGRVEHVPWGTFRSGLPNRVPQATQRVVVQVSKREIGSVQLEVAPLETVSQLKVRLESIFGMPHETQRLLLHEVDLPDHKVVQEVFGNPLPNVIEVELCERGKRRHLRRGRIEDRNNRWHSPKDTYSQTAAITRPRALKSLRP